MKRFVACKADLAPGERRIVQADDDRLAGLEGEGMAAEIDADDARTRSSANNVARLEHRHTPIVSRVR